MSKYGKLTSFLEGLKTSFWHISFSEIERVLGFSLPLSARRYNAWWANDETYGRHSAAWLAAGWETEQLDLAGESVTFRRMAEGSVRAPKTKRKGSRSAPRKSRTAVDLKKFGTMFGDPVRLRWR